MGAVSGEQVFEHRALRHRVEFVAEFLQRGEVEGATLSMKALTERPAGLPEREPREYREPRAPRQPREYREPREPRENRAERGGEQEQPAQE